MSTDADQLQQRVVAVFAERYDGEHAAFARKTAEEAQELADDPNDLTEAADVFICLLGYLDSRGLGWRDLIQAGHAKMTINEQRQWGRRDDGTWKHVEARS